MYVHTYNCKIKGKTGHLPWRSFLLFGFGFFCFLASSPPATSVAAVSTFNASTADMFKILAKNYRIHLRPQSNDGDERRARG